MGLQPRVSSVFSGLAYGFAGLIAVGVMTAACSTTTKVAQSPRGNVYLEEVTDWSFEASHPAVIDQTTMLRIVKGLHGDEGRNRFSRVPAGGGKPMRIFSDEDAEFLAPLLVKALSRAKPEQLVGFHLSSSAGSGSEPATGSVFVKNGSVHFTIAKGAQPGGFMPESVAHTDQAPAYAARGASGATMLVIDYHALAKTSVMAGPAATKTASLASAAPQAPVTQLTAPPRAQAGTQPLRIQDGVSSSEIDDIEKAKEIITKKDAEISMLRKEADWMKRQLRERDEELKALRASKVSGKTTPKKKKAEAYQTR